MQTQGIRFFLSANSENGFYSLYDRVLKTEEFDKIFVIHGGPGTGKSTLIRKISEKGRKLGAFCEEILCSSDPHSLDGVILAYRGKKIAVLDGTPPHPRTIKIPASKEILWNIGEYISAPRATERHLEITKLMEEKKGCYEEAYSLLRAAGACQRALIQKEEKRIFQKKLSDHLERTIKGFSRKGGQSERFIRAISTKKEYFEPSLPKEAKTRILLCGKDESAQIYLSNFESVLLEKKIAHTVFRSPLCPQMLDGILIEESKTLYLCEGIVPVEIEGKRIHVSRFFEKIKEPREKEIKKIMLTLLQSAYASLVAAGNAHSTLEDIYKSAMDFEGLEKKQEKWIGEMVDFLEK